MKKIKDKLPQKLKNFYHLLRAIIAVVRYGYPARKMVIIGVTGTDGKTTTSTMLYHVLRKNHKRAALISTVAAYIGDKEIDTGLHVTSPNSGELQKLLKRALEEDIEYVVLEATSHGLDQHRLFGSSIDVGVLTNITHEHLDYHRTFQNYIKAKSKLFSNAQTAVINRDDDSYKYIKRQLKNIKIVEYSLDDLKEKSFSDLKKVFKEKYNQYNALAAIMAAMELGIKDVAVLEAIKSFNVIPGRLESIENKLGIKIYVDFAHTPNALKNVLSELKNRLKKGSKLIVVFGCAGERDKAKRPIMGKISVRLADISILTAEDQRYEEIEEINKEIIKGAEKAGSIQVSYKSKLNEINKHVFIVIRDRGEAIWFAINKAANNGDIVVICGKGHEKSMNYKGVEYPWSDKEAVLLALKGKKKSINYAK